MAVVLKLLAQQARQADSSLSRGQIWLVVLILDMAMQKGVGEQSGSNPAAAWRKEV